MYIMRNVVIKTGLSGNFLRAVEPLPLFNITQIKNIISKDTYSRILLSRYSSAKKLYRLKKGTYVSSKYIDEVQKERRFSSYVEFMAAAIYAPSYLSLEYVLHKHNILTELVENFTLISQNKTARFTNNFGTFFYHKIKPSLFTGFEIRNRDGFVTYEATKAKALFDFLYLRKSILPNKESVQELRVNIDALSKREKEELRKFIRIEGSSKMAKIGKYILGE